MGAAGEQALEVADLRVEGSCEPAREPARRGERRIDRSQRLVTELHGERSEELLLGAEVQVDRALREPGLDRDIFDRSAANAALPEARLRGRQDRRAPLGRSGGRGLRAPRTFQPYWNVALRE